MVKRPCPPVVVTGPILWRPSAALLIAAKRADAISSEIAIHTEHNTDDIRVLLGENTVLTQAVKQNTDLLQEIHRHLAALSPEADGIGPDDRPVTQ
jgi:hypothetical protein